VAQRKPKKTHIKKKNEKWNKYTKGRNGLKRARFGLLNIVVLTGKGAGKSNGDYKKRKERGLLGSLCVIQN